MAVTVQDENQQSVTIFSIGHSNQSMQAFLELLRQHEVQVVVDVRSSPYSKYVPHFNSSTLAVALEQDNKQYMFMGKELGGRPDGDEFYDGENHVLYDRVAESSFFLKGINYLKDIAKVARTAIMCSEEDARTCHRHLLIGRVLAKYEVNLLHIRGDGHIQTEEELLSGEERSAYEQSLWGQQLPEQEVVVWRSIRSVSPRKQQPSSSDV